MQHITRRSKITKSSGFDALYSERELIYTAYDAVHCVGGRLVVESLHQLTTFASFDNSLHFEFAH
jgi:hypothetical protein